MKEERSEEKVLTPQEGFEVIRQMIELAKRDVRDDGFHFLLWGAIVAVSALTEWYLQNMTETENVWLPWFILPAVGGLTSLLREWKRERTKRSESVIRKWYGQIWLAFVVCLAFALFYSIWHQRPPIPLVLMLSAFATYLSGVLLQFAPLRWGSLALFAGGVLCFLLMPSQHSLVMVAAIVLGYLLPGFLLNHQYRNRYV